MDNWKPRTLAMVLSLGVGALTHAQTNVPNMGNSSVGPARMAPYSCTGMSGPSLTACIELNNPTGTSAGMGAAGAVNSYNSNTPSGATYNCSGLIGAALTACQNANAAGTGNTYGPNPNTSRTPGATMGGGGRSNSGNATSTRELTGATTAGPISSSGGTLPAGLSGGSGTTAPSSGTVTNGLSGGSGTTAPSSGTVTNGPSGGSGIGRSSVSTGAAGNNR